MSRIRSTRKSSNQMHTLQYECNLITQLCNFQIAMSGDLILISTLFLLSLLIFHKTLKTRLFPRTHLPPGSLGWPLIGETVAFGRAALAGEPERFVRERMEKYNPRVFKTSILGEPLIVFCGPAGNKFLFSNENKMVRIWWPSSVKKLLKSSLVNAVGDEAKGMRKILMTFVEPEALKRYVERMDLITQDHVRTHWEGKEELKAHPTVKSCAFDLVCRLFASINDPKQISKLEAHYDPFAKALIEFPINIPGTRFFRAMKAANAIREVLKLTVRERKAALQDRKMVSTTKDLVSHLLLTTDSCGRFLSEEEVIDNILLLLNASHDTFKSAMTSVMKYLAELPEVYEKVLREQMDTAKSKEAGEFLKWEDIQKMKYSSNVVCEVLRLSPPVSGGFREAITDFTYAGYTIPKGWKLFWSASSQKDPTIFPNAEVFEPSRFEGTGPTSYSYVPFGGGPRRCLGLEFARVHMLVFLHNIVKRFRWNLIIPDEKFGYDPMLIPFQDLPIRLQRHQPSA